MMLLRHGRIDAFDELYGRYATRVFTWARRLLPRLEDAEEVVQDVFLALSENASGYRPVAQLTTYLYTITVRIAGRARRRSERWMVQDPDGFAQRAAPKDPGPGRLELVDWLERALPELSFPLSSAFSVVVLDGKEYPEAAEILGRPEGTVKAQVHRARKVLKQSLARTQRALPEEAPTQGGSA